MRSWLTKPVHGMGRTHYQLCLGIVRAITQSLLCLYRVPQPSLIRLPDADASPVCFTGGFTPLELLGGPVDLNALASWRVLVGGRFALSIDQGRKLRFARPHDYNEMPPARKGPVRLHSYGGQLRRPCNTSSGNPQKREPGLDSHPRRTVNLTVNTDRTSPHDRETERMNGPGHGLGDLT